MEVTAAMPTPLSDLYAMIKECDGTARNISHISHFCVNITESQQSAITVLDVAKEFQTIFSSCRLITQQKIYALQVITDILSDKSREQFFRHLAPRIYYALQVNKAHIQLDPPSIRSLASLFQKWQSDKILTNNFIKKAFEKAGEKLVEKMQCEMINSKLKRYSKQFLNEYKQIQSNDKASSLYRRYRRCSYLKKRSQLVFERQTQITENKLDRETSKSLFRECDMLINDSLQEVNLFKQSMELLNKLLLEQANALKVTTTEAKCWK